MQAGISSHPSGFTKQGQQLSYEISRTHSDLLRTIKGLKHGGKNMTDMRQAEQGIMQALSERQTFPSLN